MNIKLHGTIAVMIAIALLISLPTGCGFFGGDGPSLENIPLYPNATEGESMEQSVPGGFLGGKLAQYTTTDSFDEVMEYYTDALSHFESELISHTSELGRQAAFSIPQDKGIISVAIQEFTEEGQVNITLMAVGS
jgi:hypothetical protein